MHREEQPWRPEKQEWCRFGRFDFSTGSQPFLVSVEDHRVSLTRLYALVVSRLGIVGCSGGSGGCRSNCVERRDRRTVANAAEPTRHPRLCARPVRRIPQRATIHKARLARG